MRAFAAVLPLLLALPCLAGDDFRPLTSGDDPGQFELVGIDPESIKLVDGEIRLTGKPGGYFATKDAYRDYSLEFEFAYDRPEGPASDADFNGNSGLLVNIQGPPKVWPRCIEFQLANSSVGEIRGNGGGKLGGDYDRTTARKVTKPVGQWNRLEFTSWHGTLTCSLNGVEVSKGSSPNPDSGKIGFQSEGHPIRFRKLRIKTLD